MQNSLWQTIPRIKSWRRNYEDRNAIGFGRRLFTGFGGACFADGFKDCTKLEKAKWKPASEAEAKASTAGCEVRRSKVEGTCYEVYGVKDGKLFELFYSPGMSTEDDHSRSHIYVWDLPLRIVHWSLAASIVVAWLSAVVFDSLHRQAGYIAIGLVAFRIIWGFVGSDSARLSRLTFLLPNAIRFLRRLMRGRTGGYVGLNPAGAVMLVASLGLTLISGVSGWMQITVRFFGVAWVQVLHTLSSYALLALVGLHILGVAVVSIMQRQNLVVAMFTGRKKRRHLKRT